MIEKPKYELIAVISGILTIISFSSLIINVHITKDTENFTLSWIFLVLLSQILLLIYGLINNSYGFFLQSTTLILGVLYVLYIKVNYNSTKKIEDELKSKNILTK